MDIQLECGTEIGKIPAPYTKGERDRSRYIETHDSEQRSEGRDTIEETEKRRQRAIDEGKMPREEASGKCRRS